jgi:hypothetical protein
MSMGRGEGGPSQYRARRPWASASHNRPVSYWPLVSSSVCPSGSCFQMPPHSIVLAQAVRVMATDTLNPAWRFQLPPAPASRSWRSSSQSDARQQAHAVTRLAGHRPGELASTPALAAAMVNSRKRLAARETTVSLVGNRFAGGGWLPAPEPRNQGRLATWPEPSRHPVPLHQQLPSRPRPRHYFGCSMPRSMPS